MNQRTSLQSSHGCQDMGPGVDIGSHLSQACQAHGAKVPLSSSGPGFMTSIAAH